ncbi:hypothetical protein RJ641_006070 [Dillenia turbinata]|uniref:Uncharacterized protein n=1 Tax=Dillenia turbinata TaxID=194707 RepID=A0AAN8Z5Q8_9MAGN
MGVGREVPISLDGVRDKNLMLLKKLSSDLFPIHYNDKYYTDALSSCEFTKLGLISLPGLALRTLYSVKGLFSFSVIFREAVPIYGVIVAIILQTKFESVPSSQIFAPKSLRAGYAIFASGIIVGFANLKSIFALGLFGVIVGIIMSAQAAWPAKVA